MWHRTESEVELLPTFSHTDSSPLFSSLFLPYFLTFLNIKTQDISSLWSNNCKGKIIMSFLRAVGMGLRSWGKSLDSMGVTLQGNSSYVEKCKSLKSDFSEPDCLFCFPYPFPLFFFFSFFFLLLFIYLFIIINFIFFLHHYLFCDY